MGIARFKGEAEIAVLVAQSATEARLRLYKAGKQSGSEIVQRRPLNKERLIPAVFLTMCRG